MKSLILLLVSALFLTVGCSKEKNYAEREIHLISPEKIFGFDPIHASDQYSWPATLRCLIVKIRSFQTNCKFAIGWLNDQTYYT